MPDQTLENDSLPEENNMDVLSLQGFKSLKNKTTWLIILAGLILIVQTAEFIQHCIILVIVPWYSSGNAPFDYADLYNMQDLLWEGIEFVGALHSLFWIISVISFLIWIRDAYQNLYSLNTDTLEYSPQWAMLTYFIPVVNFYKPYQIMCEIWQASDPAHTDKISWIDARIGAVPVLWWTFFLADNILLRLIPALVGLPDTIEEVSLYAAYHLIGIISTVMLLILVRKINDRQTIKHSILMEQTTNNNVSFT